MLFSLRLLRTETKALTWGDLQAIFESSEVDVEPPSSTFNYLPSQLILYISVLPMHSLVSSTILGELYNPLLQPLICPAAIKTYQSGPAGLGKYSPNPTFPECRQPVVSSNIGNL